MLQANFDRLRELLGATQVWLQVHEENGLDWVQSVDGIPITGFIKKENAELIVRMRNQIGPLLEEVQRLRHEVAMMKREDV